MPDLTAPALLTTTQAAQHLGLHLRTVQLWVREGRLRGRRLGTRWRFTMADLDAALIEPEQPCRYTNARTAPSGGASGASAARELEKLLARPTKPPRGSTTTAAVLNFGARTPSASSA
jgi:excisionase family DNA binding protein